MPSCHASTPGFTLPRFALLVLLALFLTACGGDVDFSCEPAGPVTPICGVKMPEDLEPLPDGGGLLIAEFGDMDGSSPGALTWYQPGAGADFVRLVTSISTDGGGDSWGDPDCELPDHFSPHGIHLSRRQEGLQLLVVNHSSREHILFYEVIPAAQTDQAPELAWRGCVLFPESAAINDVAALPDGGFVTTNMFEREHMALAQVKSALGLNLGHVWRWIPGTGLTIVPNTQARFPNGIATAPDGRSFWVSNYIDGELVQHDLQTGEVRVVAEVPNIDNSAWLEDGRLLLASHHSPLRMARCFEVTEGSCGEGYDLVAVDVDSGDTEVLYSHEGGGPFGPATVAVPYGGLLYAGSFSGDRLAAIRVE